MTLTRRSLFGFAAGTIAAVAAGKALASTDKSVLTSTGGVETHTLTVAELPSHTHTLTDPGHTHSIWVGGRYVPLQLYR